MTMQRFLHDKKALVGGCSKGLGKAIALQLAQMGASVTLMSRDKNALVELKKNLHQENAQNHQILVVDFNDFERLQRQIDAYFNHNDVDVLINNTQGPPAGSALEVNASGYQSAFDLLFQVPQYITQRALPAMQKKRWGRIINVASVTVKEPIGYLVLSNSIRAALTTWAKTLSKEVAQDGITVNTVLTGYFATERLQGLIKKNAHKQGITIEKIQENMLAQVPMRRFGMPEEYGHLVGFLASEQASYITGVNIPIDGGLLHGV